MSPSDMIVVVNIILAVFLAIIGFFIARLINKADTTLDNHAKMIIEVEKSLSSLIVRLDISTSDIDKLQIEIDSLKRDIGKCKDRLVKVEARCQYSHGGEV